MKVTSYIVTMMVGLVAAVHAESPLFSYQGRLLGNDGQPVNESVTMAINIYTSATASTAVYSEQVGSVPVQNGIYSFSYGTNVPALRQALGSEESWLELVISGSALSPRQRLHYTPYAVSLDENSLVQSTQFLLDMIAKHELEIQALRAQAGLMNTSGGNQYFTETFPDANGQNDLVNMELTDAYYDPVDAVYIAGSVTTDSRVVWTTNCYCWIVKEISLSNRVSVVWSEVGYTDGTGSIDGSVRYRWRYTDTASVSNAVYVSFTNGSWISIVATNPEPLHTVLSLSVRVLKDTNFCNTPGTLSERNTKLYLGVPSTSSAQLALNIPSITGRLSHAALYANVVGNSDPRLVQFNLTDGITIISNISLNKKYSLSTTSNNPSRIDILLKPSTNVLENPAVESVMFKWWY